MIVLYQKIGINNFKSLKKVSINPSLITVLVGPNSSGKSSVLQALTLLKQSTETNMLRPRGPIINLGNCEDLISKDSNILAFRISGDLTWKQFEFFGESKLGYDISCQFAASGQLIAMSAIMGPESFKLQGSWAMGETPRAGGVVVKNFEFQYQSQPNIGAPFTVVGISGGGEGVQVEREKASIFREITTIIETVRNQLDMTFIVPPFRGQDLPQYGLKEQPEVQLTSTSGSVEQASRLASTVAYHRELEDNISNWIERITGVRISSELVPGPQVTIRAHPKKPPKVRPNIVNEGYGSNQLVHLMGQIALAPEGSSICIDDPEIHLHPKAQAELAELFVEIAKKENKQLIMATHSEHILFRLLTTVAEKKLDPSQLAIYYFDKINGWTDAKELKVDDKGTLEQGLPGFFEADVGEFRKYIEAISRKQE